MAYLESEMQIYPYWCVIRGATGDPADVVIDAQGGDYILDIYEGITFPLIGAAPSWTISGSWGGWSLTHFPGMCW